MDKVQLPNGKIIDDYHRIEVHNAVMLLVENEKKELLVYKEYRHGIAEVSLTFPAGGIENNENIYEAAKEGFLRKLDLKEKIFCVLNDYIVSGSYMFGELTFIKVTNFLKKNSPINKDIENPEHIWMSYNQIKKSVQNKDFKKLLRMQLQCYGYLIMKNKIWITGSNGLVGSTLINVISSNDKYEVLKTSEKILTKLNEVEVRKWVGENRPDTIIITSALVGGIHYNNSHQSDFLYENAMIYLNVIKAAHEAEVLKNYILGASCMYPKEAQQPFNESSIMHGAVEPTNEGYAVSKILGLKYIETLNKQHNMNHTCVIPATTYGPNDSFDENKNHVIPALIKKIHNAKIKNMKEVMLWGTGKPMREFIYIKI